LLLNKLLVDVFTQEFLLKKGGLTRKLHLSDDQSRHLCIKTFTKQNWVIQCYQTLLMKIFRLSEYHVSYKGAAGKAFSTYIPALK